MILLENCGQNREKWLELKNSLIGGSEAYDAADLGPDAKPERVWSKLKGFAEPIEDNERMYFGRALEDFVGEEFCRQYISDHPGSVVSLKKSDTLHGCDDARFAFAAATFDFEVVIDGERCLIQAKTTSADHLGDWEGGVPTRVRAQALHELGCAPGDITRNFCAAFIYSPAFRYYPVEREDCFIEELFAREKKLFEMSRDDVTEKMFARSSELRNAFFWEPTGELVELLPDQAVAFQHYEMWKRIESKAEELKKNAAAQILLLGGEGKKVTAGGWKATITRMARETLDTKQWKIDDPEGYEAVRKKYGRVSHSVFPRVTAPKDLDLLGIPYEAPVIECLSSSDKRGD